MAKSSENKAKKIAKKAVKKARKPKSSASANVSMSVEEAAIAAREKLGELGISPNLQADLEWCIGSYRFDRQPSGLYQCLLEAIDLFKAARSKKAKGVTVKFISGLEAAIK